jgi:hypothetical protein
MQRLTDDGILALHISNKYVELEPVVARIAAELNLEARVWNDNSERLPGKTASSWVALARDAKTLGILAAPATDQVLEFGIRNQAMIGLLRKYGPEKPAKEAISQEFGGDDLAIEEFAKKHGSQAAVLAQTAREYDLAKEKLTLGTLTTRYDVFGPMFHPLKVVDGVPLWTDDYSDVLRVMRIKEIQSIRKFFGLPTPIEE